MKRAVIDELVPSLMLSAADRRDKLAAKIGLKKLLEFLSQFGFEKRIIQIIATLFSQ